MEGKTKSASPGDRYVAHLAHELRTPLNAIIGYADAIRARVFGPLDERYGEYADIIHEAGRHMLELANDLLVRASLSEPAPPGEREQLDPAEPAAWALRLLRLEAEAAGVELRLTTPEAPMSIVAERRAIAQMVVNLVANALRHTPKGGLVGVHLDPDGDDLLLVVRDNGSGLTPGAEAGGRGLGLVRELVAAQDGMMEIAGEPGAGTTVTLRLPRTGERR